MRIFRVFRILEYSVCSAIPFRRSTILPNRVTQLEVAPSSLCPQMERILRQRWPWKATKKTWITSITEINLCFGSKNNSSSGEIVYSSVPQSEEMETMTDIVNEVNTGNLMPSSSATPPLPPPESTTQRGECTLAKDRHNLLSCKWLSYERKLENTWSEGDC